MNGVNIFVGVVLIMIAVFTIWHLGRRSAEQKSRYSPLLELKGGVKPPTQNRREHPVLQYQRKASYDTHPANYGDPIRPLDIGSGPASGGMRAYYPGDGPSPYKSLNVPVPQRSLKLSSEEYGYPFHYQKKPLSPYDYFKPYGPNSPEMQREIVVSDTPYYNRGGTPYDSHALQVGQQTYPPFISSVDAFSPFPEVQTPWEKSGIIQTENPDDNTIMNLYRRPIAPLQDLFEYAVQDKDGFIVPLKVNYLENGDTVQTVPGRESLGPWKVNIYINNKWVWA